MPKLVLYGSYILGIVGAIVEFFIKIYYTKETNLLLIKINRYMILGVAIVTSLALIIHTIYLFVLGKKKESLVRNIFIVVLAVSIMLSLLYILPQVLQFTREFVYFGENTISTQSILRAIGFVLGIAISYLLYLGTSKVGRFLSQRGLAFFFEFALIVYAVDYIFKAISASVRLFPGKISSLVFNLMIIEDNYGRYLIYVMHLIIFAMLVYCIRKNMRVRGEFKNPALRRKRKAEFRNHRRWSYTLVLFIIFAAFSLSVLNYFDTKEVELAPAQEYQVDGNNIIIPLTDLADGHLHRFAYKTPNGMEVKFIAVKKPNGNAYGLGLDACEICGVAGYFERGDEVICKRCDVVMNKATIGFKGGCNPIPFPYNIKDEKIIIDKADLEREEKRFQK